MTMQSEKPSSDDVIDSISSNDAAHRAYWK